MVSKRKNNLGQRKAIAKVTAPRTLIEAAEQDCTRLELELTKARMWLRQLYRVRDVAQRFMDERKGAAGKESGK